MSYQIKQDMRAEITQAIENAGYDLDDIRDNAGEWIDGYLPVYYNKIVQEWQEMPSEYNDRGAAELGHMEETTIYGLMSLDLYVYYSELFQEVLNEIEEGE
jgi:hypothetical protein